MASHTLQSAWAPEQMTSFRFAKERNDFLDLVEECSDIAAAEIVGDITFDWLVWEVWRRISRYDAVPIERCQHETDSRDLANWAVGVLGPTIDDGKCFVSTGGFGELGWIRLSFASDNGLMQLWAQLQSKEIVSLNSKGVLIRAITEEEHEYLAFELQK